MKYARDFLTRYILTRRAGVIATVVLGLFIFGNVALFAMYQGRSYSGVQVAGKPLGGLSKDGIEDRLAQTKLLPDKIELQYEKEIVSLPAADLGIRLDKAAITRQALSRHWLPVVNIIKPVQVEVAVTIDNKIFTEVVGSLAEKYKKAPTDARIALKDGKFTLVSAIPGHQPDVQRSRQVMQRRIAGGYHTVTLAKQTIAPAVSDAALADPLKTLQAQQQVALSFTYGNKTAKPTASEVAGWFVASENSFVISEASVRSYIIQTGKTFGIRVKNISEATAAITAALTQQKPLSLTLESTPVAKTYTYCVGANGVETSHLAGLQSKLKTVFADARGWGLDGAVAFTEVPSGCSFTIWLSAAALMPSYGAICDAMWSCMPGSSVVLNFDRWQGASPAWNASGGSLDDYRSMVINHETGHWLGFGHSNCGGAGQPAPVMQQQSIDLQGCVFNPWPTALERTGLQTKLGI